MMFCACPVETVETVETDERAASDAEATQTDELAPRPKRAARALAAGSAQGPAALETAPPVRLRMCSADHLCVRSMEVRWQDSDGHQRDWSSWGDWLQGWYEAEKLLPSSAVDIRVRFQVRGTPGGPFDVGSVDRGGGCEWVLNEAGKRLPEEVRLRASAAGARQPVDAHFELRGPATHCYVGRAWNAARVDQPLSGGSGETGGTVAVEAPADWEHWDVVGHPRPTQKPRPEALVAADRAASSGEGDVRPGAVFEAAAGRLKAAAMVLQEVRRDLLRLLQDTDAKQSTQWLAVNSGNTLSAGLGIVAVPLLFVAPPLGVALGIGSAAAGGGALAGDTIADRRLLTEVRSAMSRYVWNALAVAELEHQWLVAESSSVAERRLAKAKVVAEAADGAAVGGVAGVTAAGMRTAAVASRVLGVAGAVLSTGVAVHGWSTTKSFQTTVREKAEEVEAAIVQTQRWLSAVGALDCGVCQLELGPRAVVRRCRSWHFCHADCHSRWAGDDKRREARCPLCEAPMFGEPRSVEDFLVGDVRPQPGAADA